MIKITSTFIFLLLSQSASSFHLDLLISSEVSEKILFSTAETEEISTISDVEFSADFQKDLRKIRIISGSDFSFYSVQDSPMKKISGVTQDSIPNLNTAKLIYPFHSFL